MAALITISLDSLLNIQYESVKDNTHLEVMVEYLNQPKVIQYLKDQGIRRGDIVEITEISGYYNLGKAIWDGEKVQQLDEDIVEYGAVPKDFFVGEGFLADHWMDFIEHNNIVHVNTMNQNIKRQLLDNFTPQSTYYTTDMGTFTIRFLYSDVIKSDMPDTDFMIGYVFNKDIFALLLEQRLPLWVDVHDGYNMKLEISMSDTMRLLGFEFIGSYGSSSLFRSIYIKDDMKYMFTFTFPNHTYTLESITSM